MKPNIIRPKLDKDLWNELEEYLLSHWDRAKQARSEQVDGKYDQWSKNYRGDPAERERSFPWPKSSNVVVKLSRMFIDTFVARTLTIMFSTRPLLHVEGFPTDQRENLEYYLNRKANLDWGFYELAKQMLTLGNKNGTVVIKSMHVTDEKIVIAGDNSEKLVTTYDGPKNNVIPFDDWYVYPITASSMSQVIIKMHRIHFMWEQARGRMNKWRMLDEKGELTTIDVEDLKSWMRKPQDVKRESDRSAAGVEDCKLDELQVVECHLKYPLVADKEYSIIATICPQGRKLIDVYFNPTPMNSEIFNAYVPFPQEDFFFGESMCAILDQSQEEASQIHNDRRNNSILANTVCFKRRNGSGIPNPSSNWYPGKVWDLEDINDLEIMSVGRNYTDMLAEENFVIQFAEKILGIGPPMQGSATGGQGKGGIYNTQGVLGVMSEGNQRQDANIRDARSVLGAIARINFLMQATFAPDDPTVDLYPPEIMTAVKQILKGTPPEAILRSKYMIRASESSLNKEVRKASLLQLAQVLGQYGTTSSQLAIQLLNPGLNPQLKAVMMGIVHMHKWMAATLLRAYDEYDTQEIIPDVESILSGQQPMAGPGGQLGPEAISGPMEQSGAGVPPGTDPRDFLANILQAPNGSQGAPPEAGMGM